MLPRTSHVPRRREIPAGYRGGFLVKKSHLLLMLACCLIPLAGITAILLFQVPTSSVLYVGLLLLCPLLHVLMMRGMGHEHDPSRHEAPHVHSPVSKASEPEMTLAELPPP